MTENEIRNRTALLLDAYISLIGAGYSPNIQDFLLLRREAIKELSGNITDMTVRSAIKSEENHYRERNNTPENTNDRGLSRTVYGRTADSHMNRQQAAQQSRRRRVILLRHGRRDCPAFKVFGNRPSWRRLLDVHF